LNQQTFQQFKAYAEQQYPDNPDQVSLFSPAVIFSFNLQNAAQNVCQQISFLSRLSQTTILILCFVENAASSADSPTAGPALPSVYATASSETTYYAEQ